MQSLSFLFYDLKHSLFNISTLFYLIIMPAGFYLLFGVMQDYGSAPFRDGNATAYVMIGMAVYGAVTGSVSSSGTAVIEIESGWGRQLALTPMSRSALLASKVLNALVTTALPVIAVNIIALFTTAEIPPAQQMLSALIAIAASSIFVFYGIAVARLVKSARAVSVASGLVVFLSFFGTTFSPLPLSLMDYARFTPMYGVTQLARYPFTAGDTITTGTVQWMVTEPLHYALINVAAWGIIFIGASILLRKRSLAR